MRKCKKINIPNFFIFGQVMIFGVIDYFCIAKINDIKRLKEWNLQMSELLIINISVMLFLMVQAGIELFSFSSAFLIIAAVFNCGQCIVNYFGYEILKHGDVFKLFGYNVYKNVISTSLKALYFCFLGIIFGQLIMSEKLYIKIKKKVCFISYISNERLRKNKSITIILFVISLPAQLYITATQIINNIQYGYNVAALMIIHPVVSYCAKFLISAVIIGMFQLKKKARFLLYATYVFLCLVTMVGGGVRSSSFLGIVVVTYVYIFLILKKKIKLRDILLLTLIGFFSAQMLITIREMRASGFSFELFVSTFANNKNSAVFSYFSEATVTHGVLGYVISNEQSLHNPIMGQFGAALLGIIPGISKISPVNLSQFDMQKILNIPYMGGSFVADFYFDHVLILGSFVWGWFIHRIFTYFEKEKNILQCAFWGPIVTQILLSVRTSTAQLPRMIIWMGLVFNFVIIFCYSFNVINDSKSEFSKVQYAYKKE